MQVVSGRFSSIWEKLRQLQSVYYSYKNAKGRFFMLKSYRFPTHRKRAQIVYFQNAK